MFKSRGLKIKVMARPWILEVRKIPSCFSWLHTAGRQTLPGHRPAKPDQKDSDGSLTFSVKVSVCVYEDIEFQRFENPLRDDHLEDF